MTDKNQIKQNRVIIIHYVTPCIQSELIYNLYFLILTNLSLTHSI